MRCPLSTMVLSTVCTFFGLCPSPHGPSYKHTTRELNSLAVGNWQYCINSNSKLSVDFENFLGCRTLFFFADLADLIFWHWSTNSSRFGLKMWTWLCLQSLILCILFDGVVCIFRECAKYELVNHWEVLWQKPGKKQGDWGCPPGVSYKLHCNLLLLFLLFIRK